MHDLRRCRTHYRLFNVDYSWDEPNMYELMSFKWGIWCSALEVGPRSPAWISTSIPLPMHPLLLLKECPTSCIRNKFTDPDPAIFLSFPLNWLCQALHDQFVGLQPHVFSTRTFRRRCCFSFCFDIPLCLNFCFEIFPRIRHSMPKRPLTRVLTWMMKGLCPKGPK